VGVLLQLLLVLLLQLQGLLSCCMACRGHAWLL
jgi:hypothetical protein